MAGDILPQLITISDLAPFATIDPDKAQAMVDDAISQAVVYAPALEDMASLSVVQIAAAKAILRAAILRWNEVGAGGVTTVTQTAGSFSSSQTNDTTHQRRGVFWPSEITALQSIVKTPSRPFALDMGACYGYTHPLWCDLMLGGTTCSCGASIAGAPIYEGG